MRQWLSTLGWLACVAYSTIPAFWFMIHPFAERWRTRRRSPYRMLVPAWMAMWVVVALITSPWRHIVLYRADWSWIPAVVLFACGLYLYSQSGKNFSAKAARRAAGGARRESRASAGDGGDPRTSAASGVPGAPVRDAGVESGDGPRGVLGPDSACDGHRCGDDPDGRCGAGKTIWRCLSQVPQFRSRSCSQSVVAGASYNPT